MDVCLCVLVLIQMLADDEAGVLMDVVVVEEEEDDDDKAGGKEVRPLYLPLRHPPAWPVRTAHDMTRREVRPCSLLMPVSVVGSHVPHLAGEAPRLHPAQDATHSGPSVPRSPAVDCSSCKIRRVWQGT